MGLLFTLFSSSLELELVVFSHSFFCSSLLFSSPFHIIVLVQIFLQNSFLVDFFDFS